MQFTELEEPEVKITRAHTHLVLQFTELEPEVKITHVHTRDTHISRVVNHGKLQTPLPERMQLTEVM